MVIYCTGYKVTFPFLDERFVPTRDNHVDLYRRVVSPDLPGLYFVGLVQPIGAIMPLAEAQSAWVADLVSGEGVLPSYDEMRRQIRVYDEQLHEAVRRLEAAHHPGRLPPLPHRARPRAACRTRAPHRHSAGPSPAGGLRRSSRRVRGERQRVRRAPGRRCSRGPRARSAARVLGAGLGPGALGAPSDARALGRRQPALLGDVLADGGELRAEPAGQRAVVEPHHRQVPGDVEARASRPRRITPLAITSEKQSIARGPVVALRACRAPRRSASLVVAAQLPVHHRGDAGRGRARRGSRAAARGR